MEYLKRKFGEQRPIQGALQGPTMQGGGFKAASPEGFQGAKAGGFSRTMQGDDPNRRVMREEYGWKMNSADYERLQKDTAEFDTAISTYKTRADQEVSKYKSQTERELQAKAKDYQKRKGAFDLQVSKAQSELSAARKKLGATPTLDSLYSQWWKQEKMPVRVVGKGDKIEATYWAPRSILEKMKKENPDLMANFVDDNKRFNISVQQGGRMRGQEMHDLARQISDQNKLKSVFAESPDVQGAYSKGVRAWRNADSKLREAESNFNKQSTAARSSLAKYQSDIKMARQRRDTQIKSAYLSRDTEVGKQTAARRGKIDAARSAYEQRAEKIRQSYKNLQGMKNE